jgi:hypothetical protein
MTTEPQIAFVTKSEPPALEIRVNFGIFAGRAATPAEIDELAHALVPEVGDVSIVAEERHEIGEEVEVSVHQVRVEIDGEHLPASETELKDLSGRLLAATRRWAASCIADRHVEVAEL